MQPVNNEDPKDIRNNEKQVMEGLGEGMGEEGKLQEMKQDASGASKQKLKNESHESIERSLREIEIIIGSKDGLPETFPLNQSRSKQNQSQIRERQHETVIT